MASKPASILKFALKHGHGELANAAAPYTLGFSTSEMTEHYKGDDYALMKWVRSQDICAFYQLIVAFDSSSIALAGRS